MLPELVMLPELIMLPEFIMEVCMEPPLPPPPPPMPGLAVSMVVVSWLMSVGRVTSTVMLATMPDASAELYLVLEKPQTERRPSISIRDVSTMAKNV